MNNTNRALSLALVLASLSLAGCSDGPSSDDIRSLVEADQQRSMAMISSLAGSGVGETVRSNLPQIEDIDVTSCDEIQDNLYRCVIDVEISLRGETTTETMTETFAKGKDGEWTVAR